MDSLPASLHVAVDARTVYAPTRRGTGKNLVDLYTLMARQRPSWRFTLFHQREADDPFVGLPNVRAQRIDIKGDRLNLWQDVRLPLAAAMSGADVLHCPANTAPTWTATPTVVTIHDLTPLDITPDAPATKSWVARVGRGARRAEADPDAERLHAPPPDRAVRPAGRPHHRESLGPGAELPARRRSAGAGGPAREV